MKKYVLKTTAKCLLFGRYDVAKSYCKVKLRYYNFRRDGLNSRNRQTVIVYQMGKVGSRTILKSLRALKNMTVCHVHFLTKDGIDRVEDLYKKNFHRARRIDNHLLWSQYLRQQLDQGLESKKKWKVVTLVRDPVAKNISSFFQNLNFSVGYEYRNKIKHMEVEDVVEELIQLFLKQFNSHGKPVSWFACEASWFDCELKPVFDIDVFSSEFPKSKGYEIYETEHVDLLLLRLENLNECACDAFKKFLNINEFTLIRWNIGSEKDYRDIYKKFLESIVLPDSYMDKMYTSKDVCHFYSQEEIEAFKAKWRRQDHACEKAIPNEGNKHSLV